MIQGVAEFLPISSSGHLALLSDFFDFSAEDSGLVSVMLHAGSLAAIMVYYFRELVNVCLNGKLILKLVAATVPVCIGGCCWELFGIDRFLADFPVAVGMAFLVTGMLLRLTSRPKLIAYEHPSDLCRISWKQTLIIGFTQMAALVPGISRSGSTISAGVLSGVDREAASTFSFLLAIPAIAGAILIKLLQAYVGKGFPSSVSIPSLIAATVVSALVSFWALVFLVKIVKRGRLSSFSWYMFAIGALVILFNVVKTAN